MDLAPPPSALDHESMDTQTLGGSAPDVDWAAEQSWVFSGAMCLDSLTSGVAELLVHTLDVEHLMDRLDEAPAGEPDLLVLVAVHVWMVSLYPECRL